MKFVLLIFLIFFPCFAQANQIPEDALVIHFLTNLQKMTLHFEQTKSIPELKKSFKSFGFFQFEKNKGLIIKQEKPFTQVFISTLEQYCSRNKTGSLENLPHFSDIKSLTDDLLSGNLYNLSKILDINYSEKNDLWQMEMFPLNRDMKNFIQKIVLKGNINVIKKVTIEYTDGTKLNIDYSPIQQDLANEIKC